MGALIKPLAPAFLLIALGFSNPSVLCGSAKAADQADWGTVDLGLRTYYFNRDRKEGRNDSIAAVQAFRLDYHSPKFGDLVSLHGSGFASLKLRGRAGEGGTLLLRDRPDGTQASYWKLGQAYAKFDFGAGMTAQVGRMFMDKPLISDTDKRATPSTTQAVWLEQQTSASSFYAVATDRGAARTDTKFANYRGTDGEAFDVYVAGASHDFGAGLTGALSYGYADNIMQQFFANLSYDRAISDTVKLKLDGYHYLAGNVGDGARDGVGSDYKSRIANVVAQVGFHQFKFLTSLQKVSGDSYQESWDGVHDETEVVTEQGIYRLSFIRGGEESIQFRLDWDLADYIDGLSLMARYVHGSNIKRDDGRSGSEWERDIELKYVVPGVEGLSFRYRHIAVRSSETFDSNDNRFIVNYRHRFNLN